MFFIDNVKKTCIMYLSWMLQFRSLFAMLIADINKQGFCWLHNIYIQSTDC